MNYKALNIVVALSCEARALIDYYRLQRVVDKPFPLYQSDQLYSVNLLVCGVGQINMAAAVGWLAARTAGLQSVWLNVGIAGHQTQEVGRLNLVHSVSSQLTARVHYPPLVARWPDQTTALLTCNQPCTEYPADQAVDMEASAFFNAASKFSDSELIQSIKVISDNQNSSMQPGDTAYVRELMLPHTQNIVDFSERLLALLKPPVPEADTIELTAHLRCSVSQKHRFLELVSKHRALDLFESSTQQLIAQSSSMSQLLQDLDEMLLNTAPQATSLEKLGSIPAA